MLSLGVVRSGHVGTQGKRRKSPVTKIFVTGYRVRSVKLHPSTDDAVNRLADAAGIRHGTWCRLAIEAAVDRATGSSPDDEGNTEEGSEDEAKSRSGSGENG